jgi:hypothetical protein
MLTCSCEQLTPLCHAPCTKCSLAHLAASQQDGRVEITPQMPPDTGLEQHATEHLEQRSDHDDITVT